MSNYCKIFPSAFFLKEAVLSTEKELQRYSQPTFRPFTTTISMLLQEVEQERVPERSILYELDKRINSVFSVINKVLKTSLAEKNNEQTIALYNSIISAITQFRQRIANSVIGPSVIDETEPKIANIVDIQKYQRVKQELVSSLSVAAEIDAAIRDLCLQIRTMSDTGHQGLPVSEGKIPSDPFPSLDIEEEKEAPVILDFPPEFNSFFNDLGTASELSYSEFKDSMLEKITSKLVPKDTENPEDKIFYPAGHIESIIMWFGLNLDALRGLASKRGRILGKDKSMQSGEETEAYQNRFNNLAELLNKYRTIITGRKFEDVIVEHPELLTEIAKSQTSAEKHGKKPYEGTEKRRVKTLSDTIRKDQEKASQESGGVFNQFEVPVELRSLMNKFGIEDEFGVIQMGEEVNENFFKKRIIPDLLQNTEKYLTQDDLVSKGGVGSLNPIERKAYTTNRAAFNYSMYQFHALHAVIAAILKRLIPAMRFAISKKVDPGEMTFVREQKDNLSRILKIIFPEELVKSARDNIMPDDKKILSKELIMKTNDPTAKNQYNWRLFNNVTGAGEEFYNKMIEAMMPQFEKKAIKDAPETEMGNYKARKQKEVEDRLSLPGKEDKKKQNLYFIFSAVDRGGPITTMFSYAYGGLYWIRDKNENYTGYDEVLAINPTYFSKKIIFKSILDYNQESFSAGRHGNIDKVSDMAAHVQDIVEKQPVDERTAFFLAYGRASLDNTIDTKIGWTQDFAGVMNEWVVNYRSRSEPKKQQINTTNKVLPELPEEPTEPPILANIYRFKYPLNYLFK